MRAVATRVVSEVHLICINTSGMSESLKALIMSGQIGPSLPAFNLRACICLVSLAREEKLDSDEKLVTLRNGTPAMRETSQDDYRHFLNQQPDSHHISVLCTCLGTQSDL